MHGKRSEERTRAGHWVLSTFNYFASSLTKSRAAQSAWSERSRVFAPASIATLNFKPISSTSRAIHLCPTSETRAIFTLNIMQVNVTKTIYNAENSGDCAGGICTRENSIVMLRNAILKCYIDKISLSTIKCIEFAIDSIDLSFLIHVYNNITVSREKLENKHIHIHTRAFLLIDAFFP